MTVSLINYQDRGLIFRGLTDHCVSKQGKNKDFITKPRNKDPKMIG